MYKGYQQRLLAEAKPIWERDAYAETPVVWYARMLNHEWALIKQALEMLRRININRMQTEQVISAQIRALFAKIFAFPSVS